MTISYESLMSAIGSVAAAEKVTKAKLRELSRDLLVYMTEVSEGDIRPINALMGMDESGDSFILTPVNWRIAAQYFQHFLPFSSNFEELKGFIVKGEGQRAPLVFGKKQKRKWQDKVNEINAFLSDETNDIWTWSNNVTVEAKPVDYAKKISSAVKQGIAKGDMTSADILVAVLDAEGMDMGQLLAAMDDLTKQEEAA